MEKLKSSITNMVLVHVTEEPIKVQKEKTLADGIKSVMGGGDLKVSKTDTVRQNDAKGKELTYIIYQTQDANNKDLGAAVESTTGGFGGDLKILVGFDPEGNILGYTLLEHAETPGLGAKADKWFQKGEKGDIIGKNPKEKLTVSKERMVERWMLLRHRLLPAVHSSLRSTMLIAHTRLLLLMPIRVLRNKMLITIKN